MEPIRYLKNHTAISVTEQSQLASARILVVGCGGLGGYVLEYLGRLGVGFIRVVDPDIFNETNLNRQILSSQMNLGKPKVLTAYHRMKAINPLVNLEPIEAYLTSDNAASLLEGMHLVIDALDSVPARLLLQDACRTANLPLVHGALAGWWGQVCVIQPGEDLLNIIYSDRQAETGIEQELGCLSFTTAMVASLQAAETVKLLLGKPSLKHTLLMVDCLANTLEKIELIS